MKKRMMFACLLAAAIVVGCDEKPATNAEAAQTTGTNATATAALPPSLRLATAPADAKEVAVLKGAVKDGDRVVVQGIVAGRADPIAENRAILTLLDTNVKTCDQNPADECKTPWDACCEPADVLAKNSVTVQVVDAEGRPVKASLASVDGVKPLARLVVSGTAKVSSDGVVLVNADGMHVVQ